MGGGQASFDASRGAGRMEIPATRPRQYANGQLEDYHAARGKHWLSRTQFANRPPLRLSLRARASHAAPVGTLGFGFWNEPFSVTGSVLSTPSVVWFFYAGPPSDMALAKGVPGWGWKAATLNTGRLPGWLLAPAALGAIALTKVPGLGRPVMSLARRFAVAHEALLDDTRLDEWHHYQLDWYDRRVTFTVDGQERLISPAPPRGPLGFVTWIDNQYAIASESGKFGFGITPVPEPQWLEIENFSLQPTGSVV